MSDWPRLDVQRWGGLDKYDCYTNTTTANTKGSWYQLVASTLFPTSYLMICVRFANSDYNYLMDIGVGGAGSEVVIIPNIHFSRSSNTAWNTSFTIIPVNIPAGTRIATRAQSSTANKNYQFLGGYGGGGFATPSNFSFVDSYGATTASSRGTSIDPGGSAWSYGSWVQMTASTTRAAKGFFLSFGGQGNTNRVDGHWIVRLGMGGAGSEIVMCTMAACSQSLYNADIQPNITAFVPLNIPSGVRLSLSATSGITDATDRTFDAVLHLVC
jgi:hypothetical protein